VVDPILGEALRGEPSGGRLEQNACPEQVCDVGADKFEVDGHGSGQRMRVGSLYDEPTRRAAACADDAPMLQEPDGFP
jgi:hypothetical protein